MTQSIVPAPSGPAFRVGLIGAGGIAHAHLPAWLALGAEVKIFSLDGAPELVEWAGSGTVVATRAEAFADVDAVDVCTPTPSHAEIVLAALDAGLTKIVCEKPLGRTAADAEQMITAAEAAGAQLYPGHVVRFFDEYARMQGAVAAGAVGTIAVQRFSRTGSAPGRAWFHDDAQSGGIILDQMIHDLDQARWTAGEVATVFARDVKGVGGADNPDADPEGRRQIRSAQVVLTHTNGAISYVTGSWAPLGTRFRTTFQIAGTDGLVEYDSTKYQEVVVSGGPADAAGRGLLPALGASNPFLTEIAEYHAAFTGGPQPRVTARDGLAAIKIAEAAVESVRTGRPVSLSAPDSSSVATTEVSA